MSFKAAECQQERVIKFFFNNILALTQITLFDEVRYTSFASSSETQGQIVGPKTKIKTGWKNFDEQKYERKIRAPLVFFFRTFARRMFSRPF